MAAYQAPPSLGFSRQEHWSGLPFPSPMEESESESEVAQSCPTLSDPMDCSPPGSTIHGTFQARVLEWGAIAFSEVRTSTEKKKLRIRTERLSYWNDQKQVYKITLIYLRKDRQRNKSMRGEQVNLKTD